jgi:hypothetical protein
VARWSSGRPAPSITAEPMVVRYRHPGPDIAEPFLFIDEPDGPAGSPGIKRRWTVAMQLQGCGRLILGPPSRGQGSHSRGQ